MSNQTNFPRLFEPVSIGQVKLKNRIVMLPMGTAYASQFGEVTERTIDYYAERARGGAALITIGNVSPYLPNIINQLVLDSDWVLMGHYELVEQIHAHGARACVQLSHAGRQKSPPDLKPGEDLVSSSAIASTYFGNKFPVPRALSIDEIHQFIRRYADAAARAKKVGYDVIEIHGGHGYLINQFISPFMNKRTDEYGGSLENRMRFPLEILRAIRDAVGPDLAIGFRLNGDDYVPGGTTIEEASLMAKMLEDAGIDYISVTAGMNESTDKMMCVMSDPEGWRKPLWAAIKKAVKVPVLAGGSLRHPDYCESLAKEGIADLIGLARPLFADPEWPRKAGEGRLDDIRFCISCLECSTGSSRRRGGVRHCAINAAAGREREFATLVPALSPKKVMVIGGGPAGMEAARVAALRGHKVTLCEKSDKLGGQLLMASQPQSKKRILWLRDYLTTQLKKLKVTIKLGVTVTPELIDKLKPDAVVIATGAEPLKPPIPGIDSSTVLNLWDILQEKIKPQNKKIAVIGGGMIGCELAEYLLETGNTVTIIEQLPSLAKDMEPRHRQRLLETLNEKGIESFTGRKVTAITNDGVQAVNTATGASELIKADAVVVAVGTKPVNNLVNILKGKIPELYIIGDCSKSRIIMEAIYEGSLAGRQL